MQPTHPNSAHRSTRIRTTTKRLCSGTPTPEPCGGGFTIYLRREIAKRAGLSQRTFRQHARVSFAKVAEYQRRGAVHFHAVIRLDGPDGGSTPPPAWATADLLTDAIRAAASTARVTGPVVDGRAHTFVFGRQLDVRIIRSNDFHGTDLTDRAVAAYIAKYATKGAETATAPSTGPSASWPNSPMSNSPAMPSR